METYEYDPRVAKLPLMDSPTKTALICLAYLIFVKILLGPAWMRNREPYDIRGMMILHNFTLVIANSYMFYKGGKHGWYWRYRWTCANVDFLEREDSLAMVHVSWLFLLSKFLEMIDTVFFVFRKKHSQITFLHVVHHFIVPLTTWYQISLGASGYNTLFGFVNAFVHIWMYLYYGLAALGTSVQKNLWWKKYLTRLQILQFCLIIAASISVMIIPGCKASARMVAINLGQALFFLVLFAKFYRNSYKVQRKTKSSENGIQCKTFIHTQDLNGHYGNKMFFKSD